eukprot:CAMPEP_0119042874 /NCGR_PEP_ID=MMETSP1177-20130426/16224_1 /TAXON_ID=2985 /ORGANISM="Ochromonas sp, Strain CCMP1899" /LENGTH=507 /DNA_ID=CAMNT_0007009937 /DNA_START=85 /DNA_END=1605 /DNA_ORIENTATION=-
MSSVCSTVDTKKFGVLTIGGGNKNDKKKELKAVESKKTCVVSKSVAHSTAPTSLDLEQVILSELAKEIGVIPDSAIFAEAYNVPHQSMVGAIKSLLADAYIVDETITSSSWELTTEGSEIASKGSPEFQVYNAVPVGGINVADLNNTLGAIAKIGLGPCMKNKWLKKEGDVIVRISEGIKDQTAVSLSSLTETSEDDLKNFKKRKLVVQIIKKSYKISRGVDYQPVRVRKLADLTKEMLGVKNDMGAGTHWSDLSFKNVNLKSMGQPVGGGQFHPLLKVRAEFRRILMEMGFEEMPTNKWVESSFWNFDALFQPQSHPARDAHDTFFMKEPMFANSVPEEYYEVVKNTHEKGGFGSIGYGCVFKKEEALKNLLRTHTTAISAQMLYKLANQEGGFKPKKYFSIDRVFRNEAMDATHLCEFHQVEGLVADYDLTLGNLIGIIRTFFEKIGIKQLRFKPAYNPYTEPSMEIFGYHPELGKWTELGNSGMFRPEMLRPMGLPPGVRVIAW